MIELAEFAFNDEVMRKTGISRDSQVLLVVFEILLHLDEAKWFEDNSLLLSQDFAT